MMLNARLTSSFRAVGDLILLFTLYYYHLSYLISRYEKVCASFPHTNLGKFAHIAAINGRIILDDNELRIRIPLILLRNFTEVVPYIVQISENK